ncbi:hypothetical protein FRB96_004599 [Tulasnella sp. 330]|nr:hypothetical protein FRB96_004599 [Tulasnella sp. 330]KAG8877388.1 hypothetical protein FRB97_003461 [Tulasnella sp. 331]
MNTNVSLTNLWIIISCLLPTVHALRNITIDDTDSIIQYSGNWEPDSQHLSDLDYGGAHTVSSQSTATATFGFTGVAVYYMSPLWPYPVTSQLTLDNGASVEVDLQDHSVTSTSTQGEETVQSAPVYGFTGLENGVHTLVVSMAAGGQYVIADAFMYTLEDSSTTSSITSDPSSSSSSSSASIAPASTSILPAPSNSSHNTTAIAVGAGLGGAVFLLALLGLWLFYSAKRKRGRDAARTVDIDGLPPQIPQSASIVGPIYSSSSPTTRHSETWSPYSATSFADPRPVSELGSAAAQTSTGPRSDPRVDYYRFSKDSPSFNDMAPVPSLYLASGAGAALATNSQPLPAADRVLSPAPPAYSDA